MQADLPSDGLLWQTIQVKAGMCAAHLGDLDWAMQSLQALLQEPVEEFHDLYLDTADLLLTLGQPHQVSF